jgi:chromosome segregation ATPase
MSAALTTEAAAVTPPARVELIDLEAQALAPTLSWQGRLIRYAPLTGAVAFSIYQIAATVFVNVSPTTGIEAASAGLVFSAIVLLSCGLGWFCAAPKLDDARQLAVMVAESREAKRLLAAEKTETARLQALVIANGAAVEKETTGLVGTKDAVMATDRAVKQLQTALLAAAKDASEKEAEIQRLTGLLTKLTDAFKKTDFKDFQAKAAGFLAASGDLGKDDQDLEQTTAAFEKEMTSMAQAIEKSSTDLTQKTDQIATLEEQLQAIQASFQQAVTELQTKTEQKRALGEELRKDAGRLEAALQAHKMATGDADKLKSLLRDIANHFAKIKKKDGSTYPDIQAFQDKVSHFLENKEGAQPTAEEIASSFDGALKTVLDGVDSASSKLASLKTELQQVIVQIQQAQAAHAQH